MKKIILFTFIFTAIQVQAQNLEKSTQEIHKVMNAWHLAAATADGDTFFGTMTKDAIYLGTESGERWKRDELREWSKKYFERDKAWDFKPYDRQIYFTDKGKHAWFEEKLDTWMGICRGSGVLKYHKKKGWKILHYNLSVTVDNDKMDDFLKITTKNTKKKTNCRFY